MAEIPSTDEIVIELIMPVRLDPNLGLSEERLVVAFNYYFQWRETLRKKKTLPALQITNTSQRISLFPVTIEGDSLTREGRNLATQYSLVYEGMNVLIIYL